MLNNKKSGFYIKTSYLWRVALVVFFSISMNNDWRSSRLVWYGSLALILVAYLAVFKGRALIKEPAFLVWFVSFFAFGLLSFIWSMSVSPALDVLKSVIVCFAALLLIQFSVNLGYSADAILKGYFVATVANVLYVVFTIDIARLGEVQLGVHMLEGWNGNGIGFMMAQGALIGCYLFQGVDKKAVKLVYLICFFAMVLLTLYTGSRTAFIMLVVELMLFFWLKNPTKRMRNVFVSVMILLVALYLAMNVESFYNVLGVRLEGLFALFSGKGNVDTSASARDLFIENGIKWFLEQPVIGYGLNNYRVLNRVFTGHFTYSHNNFIEIAVNLGIVGLVWYYSVYVYLCVRLLKESKNNRVNVFLFSALVASIISHYGTVAYYDFYQNLLLLLCFLAVRKDRRERIVE